MNRPADTAVEDDEIDQQTPEPDADKVDRQTPGDVASERSEGEADKAKQKDDDLVAESDPLVRARKGAFDDTKPKPAAKPAAKQEPTDEGETEETEVEEPPKDGETPADGEDPAEETEAPKPKPEAKKASAEDDKLLDADLPQEDWQKLTHKGKSLFLGVRKIAKAAKAEVEKATKDAAKHRGDYEAVNSFVKDQGLAGEEFRNGTILLGHVKRADPRVIPTLEKTLAEIRQANGIAEPKAPEAPKPTPPPFEVDDLEKLIADAESSFSFDGLKGLVKKAKEAKAAAATQQQKPPEQTTPREQPKQTQQQPAAHEVERVAMANIADYLVGEGIAPDRIESYVGGLLKKHPDLARAPVHKRFAEIQRVHKAERSAAKPPIPSRQPVSGRGRGAGGGQSSTTTQSADPLVLARRGKLKF